jgi:hypothetical protein
MPARTSCISRCRISASWGIAASSASVDTLNRYVQDPEPDFRAAAINGLGLLGTALRDIMQQRLGDDARAWSAWLGSQPVR